MINKNILIALAFYLYNSFITHIPFYFIRHFYLRAILGIKLGSNSAVHMGCFFAGKKVIIGSNTVINRDCYIDGRVEIQIGNNVSISPQTYILSLSHDTKSSTFDAIIGPVKIKDYVWIGVRAIILPGVTLAKGCVVGAGSVVTKSCNEYDIIAGVPSKKIGERCRELKYKLNYFPLFNTDFLR